MTEQIGDVLQDDHARLDAAMRRLEAAIHAGEDALPAWSAVAEGLDAHIRFEEEELFPALTRTPAKVIESLVLDHLRIRESLERLRGFLDADDTGGAAGELCDLRIYLDGHNRDEEIGVYRDADRRLSPDEHARMIAAFRKTEVLQ